MIFGSKNKKKKKINKKELLRRKNRRLHIILEARRIHDRALKKAREKKKGGQELSMGGYTQVKSMEEQDLAFALGHGVTKAIQISGNALQKLKQRSRKLKKSKSTHLSRLKKARKTMTGRSRA